MNKQTISIIGLGKLGACYAAFYSSNGYKIIGYDINKLTIKLLNEGLAPVMEPGLDKLIQKNKSRITATDDLGRLVQESDITFIVLPTPSKKDGLFSMSYIISVAKNFGTYLKKKNNYHLIVLVSTVLPNNSCKQIIPVFEKYSGKKCGKDFGYIYSPSLIAIGNILQNLERPDFLFLGSSDEKSRQILSSIYNDIYKKEIPIEYMSIESAELAKISLNSYVTMKITFANIIAQLCSKLPDADSDEITNALGKDRRIGKAYLRGGLGYGGPCFPRDNFAFAAMAKRLGIKAPLAIATHNQNNEVQKNLLDEILKVSKKPRKIIGILGVAYKPNCTITEESQALFITNKLIEKKRRVILYEPVDDREAKLILGNKVKYSRTLPDVVNKSDIIFISNFDKDFTKIPVLLKDSQSEKIIIDPWGMFTQNDFNNKITYLSYGRKQTSK